MIKNKDETLTFAAIILLFLTALISWTIHSWLILSAIILILLAWYFREDKRSGKKPFSRYAQIALLLIIAGIVFGEKRIVGYSFIAAGIILALIDIKKKS